MNASVRIEGFGETVDIRIPMNNLGLQLGFIDNVLSIICMSITKMENSKDLSLEERDSNCQKMRKQKSSLVRLKQVCRKSFLDREQEDFLPLQVLPLPCVHAEEASSDAQVATTARGASMSTQAVTSADRSSYHVEEDPRAMPSSLTTFGLNSLHFPRMRLSRILTRGRVAPVDAAVTKQSSSLFCKQHQSVPDFAQVVCVADASCNTITRSALVQNVHE
jgi:hypothetical protein